MDKKVEPVYAYFNDFTRKRNTREQYGFIRKIRYGVVPTFLDGVRMWNPVVEGEIMAKPHKEQGIAKAAARSEAVKLAADYRVRGFRCICVES